MSAAARRFGAATVGIALAAAQAAVIAVMVGGRLAPEATRADVPWFALWSAFTLAGAIVLERVPRSAVGWLLCAIGSIPALSLLAELWVAAPWAARIGSAGYLVIPPLLLLALPAVFPDGTRTTAATRAGLRLAAVLVLLGVGTVILPEAAQGVVSAGIVVLSALGGLALLAGHVRRARSEEPRRRVQHGVFLGGFAVAVAVMLLGVLVGAVAGDSAPGAWIQYLGLACIPGGVAAAMIGAGLWDTDLARGRRLLHLGTVVAAMVILAGALVAVVAGLAEQPMVAAAVAATGAAALVIAVIWLWAIVGSRLYGPGTLAPLQDSLSDTAEAGRLVAVALRSPHAEIVDSLDPAPDGALLVDLGRGRRLVIHPRRAGESFTRRDRDTAERMGAELATHLERLDLRRSLDEAETALATQRRREQQRLRGALHDTVGPLLVGAEMQARALRDSSDSQDAQGVHDALRQAREAMREVLDEGSPRALAAGLGPALRAVAERWRRPEVTFEDSASPDAGDIDTATASAAYLIVSEALANVSQHAEATTCAVRLSTAGHCLTVEVSDDGVGIDPARPSGIGLASMRGRALELGGDVVVTDLSPGTRVTATLPLGGART